MRDNIKDIKESHIEENNSRYQTELRLAKGVATKLILAAKSFELYPEYHDITQKTLEALFNDLIKFTNQYGALVLEINQNSLYYGDYAVYKGPEIQDNLAYLCYRDGIQWLSFVDGIQKSELIKFLNILKVRRVLENESEGDIVSDMWEAGFSHIKYETNNALWENDPLLDFSTLTVEKNTGKDTAQEINPVPAFNLTDPHLAQQLFDIKPEETQIVHQMVREEENRDFDLDVYNVLLVILKEQRDREDFESILTVIKECFQRTLSHGEFHYNVQFLKELHLLREAYKKSGYWALLHLDDFLIMLSSPNVLSALNKYWPKMNPDDPERNRALEQMLIQLPSESILGLVPILPNIKHNLVRKHLIRVIRHHALKDIRPLIHLAKSSKPAVAKEAVFILGQLQEKSALPVILEATHSEYFSVRKVAVKALITQDQNNYKELLPLMLDENPEIRKILWNFFVNKHDKLTEKALLNYIGQIHLNYDQQNQLIMIYSALGYVGCGFPDSLQFLQKQLFSYPWHFGKLRAAHRVGAALALMNMNQNESRKILEKASKSIWPSIQMALRRATEIRDA